MRRKLIKIGFILLLSTVASFIALNLIFPLEVNVSYSTVVTAGDGTVMHAFLSEDEKWRMKTTLEEINPVLLQAMIGKEDKYFYHHPGINPFAIARAAFNNIKEGRETSGASTITMQVARLLQPKKRTYTSKAKEMFRAVQLELMFSKKEILELYLNLVPYGGNIEGVKAASLLYFGCDVKMISPAQAVTLAVIPNRPRSLVTSSGNQKLIAARNKWINRLAEEGSIEKKLLADALNEPVEIRRKNAPKKLEHLSIRLKSKFNRSPVIHTAIDKNIQSKTESFVFSYTKRLQRINIHNAAVIVVENKSGEVKAYCGSNSFYDAVHHGQVDGVRALRSPGSTLKPLLYAAAADKGIITPKTVLEDVPVNFAGYAPQNYNEKYSGKVTAEKALAFSLNVPAVGLLDEISVDTFILVMKKAGFSALEGKENRFGLSLILGGCGVRLEELAAMYATFANGGMYKALQLIHEKNPGSSKRIMSQSAAFMITEMLTQPVRPDLPNNFQSSMNVPKIAWKTGTSYGRRDAWSIGFNKKYTVAVWVGNFDGTGIAELTGADVATPLMFDIFNSIDRTSSSGWFAAPEESDLRFVCSESGKSPSMNCSDLVTDYFIPKVSDNSLCSHSQEVNISPDERYSFCMNCLPEAGFKKKLYPNLPPSLISFYRSQLIPFAEIPPHNPGCIHVSTDNSLRIAMPVHNKEYIFEKASDRQLQLSCYADKNVEWIYWYINNKFYKKCRAPEKIFFRPDEGINKVSCSDDKGRNSDVVIVARYL